MTLPERSTDVPFPRPVAKKPAEAKPREGAWTPPAVPTVGSFYAEHRALIDARKGHLERVGMIPEHVKALAMPDLSERPAAPPVFADALPDVNMAAEEHELPRLPKLPGVNVDPEGNAEE